jgi:hypothetical protein
MVSFAPERGITYALPQDVDRAYVESIRRTEWQLDGLHNHPNPMVHIPVALIAIPLSLKNQVTALLNSAPRRKVVAADAALRAATMATRFSETLAREVASQFPAPAPAVVLREEFPSAPSETMPVSNPRGTTLEIRVQKAALAQPGGSAYSTALRVDALGILTSARDQRVIYCCQLNYVSESRRFDAWAAHDARLFREELAKASADMGRAMAQRLSERDWITSNRDLLAGIDRN